MDVQAWKQPVTNKGTEDTYDKVSNKPEPAASHDLSGQPASDDANDNNDQEAFIRKIHLNPFVQNTQQPGENSLGLRGRGAFVCL